MFDEGMRATIAHIKKTAYRRKYLKQGIMFSYGHPGSFNAAVTTNKEAHMIYANMNKEASSTQASGFVCRKGRKFLTFSVQKPKSVTLVIYLDVVNNYTVIQPVKQILDDFEVSAVSSQNCAGKCAKSQVLFLPTASQSFFRP